MSDYPRPPVVPEWYASADEWKKYTKAHKRWRKAYRRHRRATAEQPRWVMVTKRVLDLLDNPLVRSALASKIKELR